MQTRNFRKEAEELKQIDKLLRRILSRKKNRPYSGWAITDSAFCDWLDTEEDEAWKDL